MSGLTATWLVLGLVLILFGARAWVVETSRGRLTTAGGAQRGLTAAVAASLVLLVVMATVNGGAELISLLSNGQAQTTVPADGAPVQGAGDQAGQPAAPAQPGAADPNAAQPGVADPNAAQPGAADPNAAQPGAADPNAAQPGAADPNAQPGGGAPAPAP